MLELLALLFGMEQAVREQKALERRLREARLPKQKTAADYDFKFPKRIPKATIMRLFDCDFIERHECRRFDWAHRNWQVASSHRTGIHGGRAWPFGSLHPCCRHDQSSHQGSDQWSAGQHAQKLCPSQSSPPR